MKKDDKYLDFEEFEKLFNKKLKKYGLKTTSLSKFISTGLMTNMIVRDENASIQKDTKGNIVVDTELRDTEIVPFTYKGGIEEFIKKEVLPYHNDAFVDETKTQIGYEINFTKYFYKAKELENVETIVARIKELEKESDGMMKNILEGLYDE